MANNANNNAEKASDLNLSDIISIIWNNRKTVFIFLGIGIVVGLFISFTTPKEYLSETKILPEVQGGLDFGGGALGGLASLSGINLGGVGTGGIQPQLYPMILRSNPFLIKLMKEPFYVNSLKKEITIFDYVFNELKVSPVTYMIGVPRRIINLVKPKSGGTVGVDSLNSSLIAITFDEYLVMENLKDRIIAMVDPKTSVVTLRVELQDPKLSAEVCEYALTYLQDYLRDYKQQKVKENLEFVESQLDEAKNKFHDSQNKLARFRDANKNVVSSFAQTEEQRLQSEYDLSFNIYNTLAQQQEQARIKVQESLPVFKVLEPPMVPNDKRSPRRGMIMVVCFVLGIFAGIGSILVRLLL